MEKKQPDMDVPFANQSVTLYPERGAYLPESQTLLVADTHFGKASVFGRAGIPVPQTTTDGTLLRIDAMLECCEARRLLILGDLWHGRVFDDDPVIARLSAWREQHRGLGVELVTGNHDRHMPRAADALNAIDHGAVLVEGDIEFRHDPAAFTGGSGFAGHLHPVIRMKDVGHTTLRLPCFHVTDGVMILPAVGAFTGGHPVRATNGDRVFACADDEVVDVSCVCQ